jgi:hypothetical protein
MEQCGADSLAGGMQGMTAFPSMQGLSEQQTMFVQPQMDAMPPVDPRFMRGMAGGSPMMDVFSGGLALPGVRQIHDSEMRS